MSKTRLSIATTFIAVTSLAPAAHAAPDLDTLSATQAAADICAGKYTSEALVTAALERAKAHPELNAFITLDEVGALRAAKSADAARKRGRCKPWKACR